VLLGEDLRGRHDRPLVAAADGGQQGQGGHHRLATAHVPLQQAAHGHLTFDVGEYIFDGPPLGRRQLEREGGDKPLAGGSSERQAGSVA
jgi:hypothetical protein